MPQVDMPVEVTWVRYVCDKCDRDMVFKGETVEEPTQVGMRKLFRHYCLEGHKLDLTLKYPHPKYTPKVA